MCIYPINTSLQIYRTCSSLLRNLDSRVMFTFYLLRFVSSETLEIINHQNTYWSRWCFYSWKSDRDLGPSLIEKLPSFIIQSLRRSYPLAWCLRTHISYLQTFQTGSSYLKKFVSIPIVELDLLLYTFSFTQWTLFP